MRRHPRGQTTAIRAPLKQRRRPTWTTLRFAQHINTAQFSSWSLQCPPISIPPSLSTTLSPPSPSTTLSPSMAPLTTRSKNKTTHPGAPDMTPSQRSSAGLPPAKKPAKLSQAKELAALKAELRAAQEIILNVSAFALYFSYLILTYIYFSEPFRPICILR